MAKCLIRNGEIVRLPETDSADRDKINRMLKDGWDYCGKKKWKDEVREDVAPSKPAKNNKRG